MLNTNTGRMHHSGVGREWDGQPDLKELSPGDLIALSLCLSTKTLRVYAGGRLLGQMIAPEMRHKMRPPMRWLLRTRLSRASFVDTEVGRRLGRKSAAEQTLRRHQDSDRARCAFTASRGLTTTQACCHVTTCSASRG